jgi:[ribosomal protein S18]-alanine N-acetyltransferase
MDIHFKSIHKYDYPFLREMLYVAVFVPEEERPLPFSIIDLPEISKYIDNWNDTFDFGLIALYHDEPVGAIWCRLFTEDYKGYGYIDSETPEVSMALKEEFRNRGFGTQMMNQIFNLAREKGFKALSLSVDKRNMANRLYLRMGFEIVDNEGADFKMKKAL